MRPAVVSSIRPISWLWITLTCGASATAKENGERATTFVAIWRSIALPSARTEVSVGPTTVPGATPIAATGICRPAVKLRPASAAVACATVMPATGGTARSTVGDGALTRPSSAVSVIVKRRVSSAVMPPSLASNSRWPKVPIPTPSAYRVKFATWSLGMP